MDYLIKPIVYKKSDAMGTYLPINHHLDDLTKKVSFIDLNSILKGQKILFSFIMSHVKNSALIDTKNLEINFIVNGKSQNKYA